MIARVKFIYVVLTKPRESALKFIDMLSLITVIGFCINCLGSILIIIEVFFVFKKSNQKTINILFLFRILTFCQTNIFVFYYETLREPS